MSEERKPHAYTAQYLGKWHAGFTVGNQSFVLSAFEGTEEEAKWYAEMLNKAFSKFRVVEEVELDFYFQCKKCGSANSYEDSYSGTMEDEGKPFCKGCGNPIKR